VVWIIVLAMHIIIFKKLFFFLYYIEKGYKENLKKLNYIALSQDKKSFYHTCIFVIVLAMPIIIFKKLFLI